MSCLKGRYGDISDAALASSASYFNNPAIATSNYFYPHSSCRLFCHCCMRRADFSYPDNPGFRIRVPLQEWQRVVAPLIADLNSIAPLCTTLRTVASPCIFFCASTRGSWQEPNPIRELNVFYKFIEKSNKEYFNPRNMEVRLLVSRPPAVGRMQNEQDHKIYLAIHMFNDIEEIRAMPQPVVGVTPGYPRQEELVYCLWSFCPGLCCLPVLNYRLKPSTAAPVYVSAAHISLVPVASHGGFGKNTSTNTLGKSNEVYASDVSIAVPTAPSAPQQPYKR